MPLVKQGDFCDNRGILVWERTVSAVEFAYHFEKLGERISICVTPDHKFGTDAFLLSDFASPRRKDVACDLGTGCGIVGLLWYRDPAEGPRHTYCVDLQPKAIAQLRMTLEENADALDGRITPVLQDLKVLGDAVPPGSVDVVTCNPPYKIEGRGIMSTTQSDQLARHETACTMADVCRAAARLLRFGGRLCVCQRPERLADVLEAMRQAGLEPKRVRFVQQREGMAPWLFLAEGRKGGKPFLQVEAPLIIEGEGGFSPELLAIYGKFANKSAQED